jgi:mutual gliding-motility protein MglA
MAFINYKTRELNAKIVYAGPTGSGKTTNLRVIAERTEKQHIGELVSLERGQDHTAYFDFLPMFLGRIRGFRSRLNLYTIPGKAPFESTRRMIVNGVDALVFVVDSDPAHLQDNLESLRNVKNLLVSLGAKLESVPHVFQFNKRDIPGAVEEAELRRVLETDGRPVFPATALTGQGVFDTLRTASKLVIESMISKPGKKA